MKSPKSRRSQRRVDNEPVFDAETGELISNTSASNIIPFPGEQRQRPSFDFRPTPVDPDDFI